MRLFPVQEIQGELHIDGGAEGKHILVHVEGVGVVGRGDALFLIAAAEEAVQAGGAVHVDGEILGAHLAFHGDQRIRSEDGFRGMAGDAVQLGMVIDERRRPEEIGAVGGAAVRFGCGFRGAADELRNGFAEGLVEGTGGADELCFGGDDVVPGAAVHDARGEDARILRIVHAGDERLERHHDAGGGDDSIMALMGGTAVGGLPVDADGEAVAAGHARAVLQIEGPGRQEGPHVHAVDGVHAVEAALFHVVAGFRADFLGHLEEEFYGAGDLVLMGGEELCRAEEHGRVAVMAAGVHDARILRAVGLAGGGLLNGEGVDVCAEHDRRAGIFAAEGADAAGDVREGLHLHAGSAELLCDALRGADLLRAQLRVCVEPAAEVDDIVFFLKCQCFAVHQRSPFPLRKSSANRA